MQGNIFNCGWKKLKNGYQIWLKAKPELISEKETLEEAEEKLRELILDWVEDPDSAIPTLLEYDPPMPVSETLEKYLSPELFLIGGDEVFDIELQNVKNPADDFGKDEVGTNEILKAMQSLRMKNPNLFTQITPENQEIIRNNIPELSRRGKLMEEWKEKQREYIQTLFEGGICPECHRGIGYRTDRALELLFPSTSVDGGFVRGEKLYSDIQVFSERILSLLTDEERSRLKFRQVCQPRGRSRVFYELMGMPDLDFISVNGFARMGHYCETCNRIDLDSVHLMEPKLKQANMHNFVAKDDLPDPLPDIFLVGSEDNLHLGMTRARWDAIRGQKGASRIISKRLGVVRPGEYERKPKLPPWPKLR